MIGGHNGPSNISFVAGGNYGELSTGAVNLSVYNLGGSAASLGSSRLGRVALLLDLAGSIFDVIDGFHTSSHFRIVVKGGYQLQPNDPRLTESGANSLLDRVVVNPTAPPPPRCFVAGTPILMADGSTKPIEAIRPGDEVAAFDPDAQQGLGPLRPGKVTRTFTNVTRTIINLRGLHMTPGHVVLMDNGEWDIISRALKDDRAIVEEREGPDGASKATLVRARTGACSSASTCRSGRSAGASTPSHPLHARKPCWPISLAIPIA